MRREAADEEDPETADTIGAVAAGASEIEMVETLPRREDARALTVVGLGGSAGSIPALEAFFEGVSASTDGHGSAYVVVLHLSTDYESHLAEVLSRSAHIPVRQVRETTRVERDQVYVIPPGKQLEMRDGTLFLRGMETERGNRVAVDTFFRTLAEAHGPQSVAVVLSGTGADGTLGIRQIKEVGGLVIVQSPSEAEYDAMPRSAIATGLVDYVLSAANIPAQIAAYWETSWNMRVPAEAAPSQEQREEGPDQEAALLGILNHVRAQTGHEFALYKRATVLRRVARRLQINGLRTLPAYLDFLRSHPAEVGDLVGDLLISVTQFFRDPEAWQAVERDVIPRLFQGKGMQDEVRAWVCGCATGEEAYTLAMLLLERAAHIEQPQPRVQIFATDMDADAIARARSGIYPETIVSNVSEERLRRWFYRQNGSYVVRKELREIVLFASHDVLRDTPFSRVDLVTCRNLLIYLNREAQERVFETFHFALRPDGRLLLGPSESADTTAGLFGAIDKQYRIYARRPVARAITPPIPGAVLVPTVLPSRRSLGRDFTAFPPALPPMPASLTLPAQYPVSGGRELLLNLMERYGPPTALIDEAHDILHLSNGVGRFLRVADGEPTRNLLQLVHPDLRIELRTALYMAKAEGSDQTRLLSNVVFEGRPSVSIRLKVRPLDASEGTQGFFFVQFEEFATETAEELQAAIPVTPPIATTAQADLARQLEEENATLQRHLRSTIEQYEAMTEELKASNEELQAMNEEQRSAAEELETSKEELQSLNEELSTVNHELKARVEEVSRTNSDLQNFLASTNIGTIFLDRQLRVKRYTPAAEALFNLIPTDVERPLAHVTNHLHYSALLSDAERVLERLSPVDREVTTLDNRRHFLARLLPYRSMEDRIEGVVLTFVDITERRNAEAALRASEEQFRRSIEDAPIPMIMHAEDGEVLQISRAWTELTGYTLADVPTFDSWLSRSAYGPGADAVRDYMRGLFQSRDHGDHNTLGVEFDVLTREGNVRYWSFSASAPGTLQDGRRFIVGTAVDITERKQAETSLRESEERFRLLVEGAQDYAMFLLDTDSRITFWSSGAERIFGWTEAEALGQPTALIFTPEDREHGGLEHEINTALATGRAEDRRWHLKKDGSRFWADGLLMLLTTEAGNPRGFAKITRDATEQKQAADALLQAHDELEMRVGERTKQLTDTLEALELGLAERQRLRERTLAMQEAERKRISRELHDQTGQYLTGFALGLKSLEGRLIGEQADLAPSLSALQALVDGLTQDIHRIAVELRPTALDDLGLEPALRGHVADWAERIGIAATFEAIGLESESRLLSPAAETAVYRVVQEALNNAAKYAVPGNATRITVTLQRFNDQLQATVEDDGPGFDVERAVRSGQLGLASMRERAELVGGTLDIESSPEEGSTVYLRIPIQGDMGGES